MRLLGEGPLKVPRTNFDWPQEAEIAALTWLLVKDPLLTKLPKTDGEYTDLIEKLQANYGAPGEMKGNAVRQKLLQLFDTHGAEQGYVAT